LHSIGEYKSTFKIDLQKGHTFCQKQKLFVWYYYYSVESFMLIINNYLPRTVLHDTYVARTHSRILPVSNFSKTIGIQRLPILFSWNDSTKLTMVPMSLNNCYCCAPLTNIIIFIIYCKFVLLWNHYNNNTFNNKLNFPA